MREIINTVEINEIQNIEEKENVNLVLEMHYCHFVKAGH